MAYAYTQCLILHYNHNTLQIWLMNTYSKLKQRNSRFNIMMYADDSV